MIIYAVDDEPLLLEALNKAILCVKPDAELFSFARATAALERLDLDETLPDVAFIDIELPGIGGLELAKRIRKAAPNVWIVFVTGYAQYAIEAFAMHANGYILKPVSAEKIRAELDAPHYKPMSDDSHSHLRVQCFGNFEVFYDDMPLHFQYSKSKELFAYLIDRRGTLCTNGEIMGILWGDDKTMLKKKSYISNLRIDLTNTLAKIGCKNVITKQRGSIAVVPENINCDYFDWLDGKTYAINKYRGEYMAQYSWGEFTHGELEFK